MMLPSINMMSAAADSTAVKSDELQRSTTSISDTTPTDIEDIPSDTIPALSKRELRRQRVAKRNLHYNILGGPSYTPDFGVLVGGSALMTFRMNPSDTTQRRSVVPVAIALMFKGGLNLMTKPQLFLKATASVSSELSHIKIQSRIFMASAIPPIKIMNVEKIPANTVTAASK